MKRFLILSAVAVAACSQATTAVQTADTAIAAPQTQADIALACAAIKVADMGFQIAVQAGSVDAGMLATEQQVVAGITKVCTPPYPQNTVDVVKTIFGAAAQVSGLTSNAHAAASQ